MAESTIEWTELTWNPVTGCKKISPGCKFCYAEVMSRRLKAMGVEKYKNGFKIKTHPESLNIPFTWKKPKVVFVNSMSDLFHDEISLEFIKAVFSVMNATPQHTYQVLTKRADRLLLIANELNWTSNIWMGVSIENEKYVQRVTELSQTPAKTKFLSVEPLLGHIKNIPLDKINWVIVGGESGHGARPVKHEWIESVRLQCENHNVPFFFKQWGKPKFNTNANDPTIDKLHPRHAKGGCELDGKIYRELPIMA
ncbi:protein gp37 [Mucilaginibacter frigoritolerans]|uniref:Protein gp37 n=1 Tax=Mucilaginibacter frigoritolerans TaxID=652788 RepID=A0A562TW91_9SPHI|nr:phage Gp37/Gp68 family protein [Mucilaginibacter frigoritolerans]TWI97548.1 protein gp37 [Mucilaginibacter frigoritolerans]